MSISSTTEIFKPPQVSHPEALGETCSLHVKVREHWIKAKENISYSQALMVGSAAAIRSTLPVQVRSENDEVLAEL